MASMQPVLVLMVKEPVMGRVKSRLAAQVGGVRATAFQRANLAALVRRLSLVRRWHIVLAVGQTRQWNRRCCRTCRVFRKAQAIWATGCHACSLIFLNAMC
jgi:glycosyltransferase A (GT-A) superfamily protein (DUF2064 family)